MLTGLIFGLIGPVHAQFQPEPNPPVIESVELYEPVERALFAPSAAPATEWTNHKSADGAHPDGNEQKMMWLMNRARQNPTAEGIWLAESTDPDIKGGRDFFNVDTALLKSDLASLPVKPPAAFDVRLYNASRDHSLDLIARDTQDHIGQIDKVNASGFIMNGGRFSVFWKAKSALNSHAALNIDWGGDASTGGMQDPPGHRYAIMGSDIGFSSPVTFSNVGLALVADNDPVTKAGPLVFSGAYVQGGTGEFNRFIVGTVWKDLNLNQNYDPGEGINGVTVTPDSGTYYAITGSAGGYSIPITTAGSYTVTFSGGGISASVSKSITVGDDSVLLDLLLDYVDFDFTGDRKADLLARYNGGDWHWLFEMNSQSVTSSSGTGAMGLDATWEIIGVADFGGDGNADILARQNGGDTFWLFEMDGSTVIGSNGTGALGLDANWRVEGLADFGNDGKADILARHITTNVMYLFEMDGNTPTTISNLGTLGMDSTWEVIGLADFGGDDNADILVRKDGGDLFWLFEMDGASVIGSNGTGALGLDSTWSVVAATDFTGDGKADLLTRKNNGDLHWLFEMNGNTVTTSSGTGALGLDSSWQAVVVSDFGGDGKADLLMRQNGGDIHWLFEMDGATVINSNGTGALGLDASWDIIGYR